jgi:hypothetical protein
MDYKESPDQDLKIGLFSFVIDYDNQEKVTDIYPDILRIINKNNHLDLIVFSGFTLRDKSYLNSLSESITNTHSLIFLEVWVDEHEGKQQHKGYFFMGGKLFDRGIFQVFGDSKQINKNHTLMNKYLKHVSDTRIIKYRDVNICWIICGEQNVVKNLQGDNNRVIFRIDENQDLKSRFEKIIMANDIFINPTHTQMGNQGKLSKRRAFFSKNKKLYCSVSNLLSNLNNTDTIDLERKLKTQKTLQYCVYDGNEIRGEITEITRRFIFKTYSISGYFL